MFDKIKNQKAQVDVPINRDPHITKIFTEAGAKNLGNSELRMNIGVGLLIAIPAYFLTLLFFHVVLFAWWENFAFISIFRLNLLPFGTLKSLWALDISLAGKLFALFRGLLGIGLSAIYARLVYFQFLRVTDGYKHISGRKAFIHSEYAKDAMKEELKTFIESNNIQQSEVLNVMGGELPTPVDSMLSTALVGMPGAGKTVIFKNYLSEIVKDESSVAIIADYAGDMTEMLPADQTIILNPVDERAWRLAFSKDIETKQEALEMWNAIMPDPKGDPFWTESGRPIGTAATLKLMKRLKDKKIDWTVPELCDLLTLGVPEIKKMMNIYNKETSRFVSDDEENKTTQGILATLTSQMLPLFNLADAYRDRDMPNFSMKEWLIRVVNKKLKKSKKYKNKRFIVLQFDQRFPKLSQAYIKIVLSTMSSMVNSPAISNDPNRRIWLLLDELPQYGKISGFAKFLEVSRKKGIKVVFAWQTMDQMPEIYGKEMAENIYSMINNWFFLKMNSESMKAWAVKKLDKRKVFFWKHTYENGKIRSSTSAEENIDVIDGSVLETQLGKQLTFVAKTKELFAPKDKPVKVSLNDKKSGVSAIVSMQGLSGVYKILYPFNQIGHQWEKNPSLIEASWIENWHKYIQDENDENLPEHIKQKQQEKELKEYADKELQELMENFDSFRNESNQRKKEHSKQEEALNEEGLDALAKEQLEIERYKNFMDNKNKIPQKVDEAIKNIPSAIPAVPLVVNEENKELADETQELFSEQIGHAASELVLSFEVFDSLLANPSAPSVPASTSSVVIEKKKKEKEI